VRRQKGRGTSQNMHLFVLLMVHNILFLSIDTGNIFRSVTLLAATWCEQQDDLVGFDPAKALTNENIECFMKMLSFGKFNDKYDIRIHGLGMDMLVSEVQNTELKSPKVSKNIPTVAEVTQGTY
jgi:hypothetical protein